MPPLAHCRRCSWRRCMRIVSTYHTRWHVGRAAPVTLAASTHASTAWLANDRRALLVLFFSPDCSRNSFVCQPSLVETVRPIARSRRYRCSLPTWTGEKLVFHVPPVPRLLWA